MAHKAPFSVIEHEVCTSSSISNTRSGLYFTGTYDANSLPLSANEGDYCVVSNGNSKFDRGSTLIYFGDAWNKIETSDSITLEGPILSKEDDISEVYFN